MELSNIITIIGMLITTFATFAKLWYDIRRSKEKQQDLEEKTKNIESRLHEYNTTSINETKENSARVANLEKKTAMIELEYKKDYHNICDKLNQISETIKIISEDIKTLQRN